MKAPHALMIAAVAAVVLPMSRADEKPGATVKELLLRDLVGAPGKQLRMATVTYPPGASSPPHEHHAQVAVYVLEGTLRMQVKGQELVTLKPGDIFYEQVGDVHEVSANASDTEPAKFVVFMVKDK